MAGIQRLHRYLEKVFDFSASVRSLEDGRHAARVPLRQVFEALFWGTVLRQKSLHGIEAECREGVLRGRVGPISDSTIGYALQRLDVESLRQMCYAVARRLKRNGVLQWQTAAGNLVMAVDGIEVFRSERRCCERCLRRQKRRGEATVTEFYHRVVVASLVGFGFRLVVDLELQRGGENELAAAGRLLARLRQQLGRRFFQILTVDALYAGSSFFAQAQQLGWEVVAVLKDNQPDLQAQADQRMDREPDWEFSRNSDRTHYRIWEEEQVWWEPARTWVRLIQVDQQQEVHEWLGGSRQRRVQSSRRRYLSNCERHQAHARSICRLAEVRWELETSTFSHATTEYGLKHAQVHAGKPRAFEAQLWIRLLAISLFMVYVYRQVWSHYRHRRPSLQRIVTRFYWDLARDPQAWDPG